MVSVAASPGTAAGTARVMLDPVSASVAPGEILVAPSTDPGWTPQFRTAGGLVMEMGGANSHGAVVARGDGIPAVVGVPRATERVSSGDRLTVNGTSGTVNIDQADADGQQRAIWSHPYRRGVTSPGGSGGTMRPRHDGKGCVACDE